MIQEARFNLAANVSDLVLACSAMPSMLVYYAHYPIWNMIYDLYRFPETPGAMELFYAELAERIPGVIPIDMSAIEQFITAVDAGLNREVELAIGKTNAYYTYSMKRWIDFSSVELEVISYVI